MDLRSIYKRIINLSGIWLMGLLFMLSYASAQGQKASTTTIAASGSAGNYTLTTTVTGPARPGVAPSGNVSFEDTSNGNLVLGTGTLGAPTVTQSFIQEPSPATSFAPWAVAIADFNHDGKPDMVVEDEMLNQLNLFVGNGDGTFSGPTTISVSASTSEFGPPSIVVADFNKDGIPDVALIVASGSSTSVSILLGNGNGTFATSASSGFALNTVAIGVGDVNGDGNPDYIALDGSNGGIGVWTGTGTGTFTSVTDTSGDRTKYTGIVIGDFNGDGKPDLFLIDNTGTRAFLRLGNGNGTFQVPTQVASVSAVNRPVIGDFNGDGKLDIAMANPPYNTIQILLGNGDGTFALSTVGTGTAVNSGQLVAADFNADGKLDLLTTTSAGLLLFVGNGNGTFQAPTSFNFSAPPRNGGTSYVLGIGDLNNDGNPDLAMSSTADSISVVLDNVTATSAATLSGLSIPGGGTHNVDATFPGSANYLASTSATVALAGSPISTALTVQVNPPGSVTAQQVALTAVLSPYSYGSLTTNGESVSFLSNGVPLGSASLSSGVATLQTTSLTAGTDTISVSYPADGNFLASGGSTSTTVTVAGPTPTVTEPTSSVNPIAFGESTTLSALVDTGGGVATGTVIFTSNGTSIGTGTVHTVSTTNLLPSSHNMAGSNWGGYCGSLTTPNVVLNTTDFAAPDGTTTSTKFIIPAGAFSCGASGNVGTAANLPVVQQTGQIYTVSVWMRGAVGGEYVEFGLNDGYLLGVLLTTSWQRYTVTFGAYNNDGQEPRGFEIRDVSVPGETFYAWGPQVEPAAAVGPYVATSADPASGSGGLASLATTALPVGSDVIVAAYAGDAHDLSSTSQPLTEVVNKTTPSIRLSSSNNPIGYGSSTTFTAFLDTGGNAPTGTVSFTSNGAAIGSGTVSTVSTTNLLQSSNQFTGAGWAPGGTVPTVTINNQTDPFGGTTASTLAFPAVSTTESLLQNNPGFTPPANSVYTMSVWMKASTNSTVLLRMVQSNGSGDQALAANVTTSWQRFTFTSTPFDGTAPLLWRLNELPPSAAATVFIYGAQLEESSSVGPYVATTSAAASGSGGVATLTTSTLPSGSDSIVAAYGGDANDLSSTSQPFTEVVTKATPTITWANPAAITYGTALSATQLNATASVGGTFAFLPIAGTVLPVGSQTLNVTFTPTDTVNYNTQTASTTILITRVAATLAITSTVNPSTFGTTVTFSFNLTGVAGYAIPSGVVVVTDGVSPLTTLTLDPTGKATYTTSTFVAGVHPLTAVYGGDINYR